MAAQTPIAVVGIGCRFPFSDGVDAFWRNLVEARSCVGDIPGDRWQTDRFAGDAPAIPGRTYCLKAGMDGLGDCYDAGFFQLDADEIKRMDPQQGLALELAWHACEDAGIALDRLTGEPVGVFVGVSTRDFDRRMSDRWQHIDMRTSTGASGAVIANRISYQLGLTGPSIAIDGACASSLMSLHMACRAIADGECSLALAGGVLLILSPANMIAFAQAGALARDGRCKPFSADADGYVCGEGGGMVVLKRLDQAIADGDRIRAVVSGSAVNHNGRSNGMSAPYRHAQQQVMRTALGRAGIEPATVDYVEAHAVGTQLGDAIETQAIRDIYDQDRPEGRSCFLGSVKSNIGHLEASAGIASFIKAVLMVEQGVLPPSLHCEAPSKLLRLEKGQLRLCHDLQPWPSTGGPRRAGVSAFSFGGSNAHVVIEQAPPQPGSGTGSAAQPSGPWLMAVSAPDEPGLRRLADAYAEAAQAMRDRGEPLSSLRDLCAATLAQRRLFPLRKTLVVRDWDDAIDALRERTTPAAAEGTFRIELSRRETPEPSDWPPLEGALESLDIGLRNLVRPIALLFQLGLTRLAIDGESDDLNAAAEYAASLGMAVSKYDENRQRPGIPVLTDHTADVDALWEAPASSGERLTYLCAGLLQHGYALRWSALAALTGANRIALPLYPFERRRNHVMLDDIDPARAGLSRAFDSSTAASAMVPS